MSSAQVEADLQAVPIHRNRNFMFLWMAQAISQVAQNAINFGLLVLVQERTNSTTHMAVAVLSFILPGVAFGILAGVVVDRAQKKTVLLATNLLRSVIVLGYLLFDQTIGLIYLTTFVFSIVSQFFAPAEAASIPMLLPKNQLIAANSLFNLTFNVAQLIGMVMVAPLIIKVYGTGVLFASIAVLYVIAGLLVANIPSDRRDPPALSPEEGQRLVSGVWREIVEGWNILTADLASTLALTHLTLASTMMPLVAMLGPNYVVNVIKIRSEDVAIVFFPAGAGMLVGTLITPRLARRFGKTDMVLAGLVVMALALFGMAGAKVGGDYLLYNVLDRFVDVRSWPISVELLSVVMVLAFILGVAFALVNIPAQTTLQERCPTEFRGRIFAVQFTLSSAVSIIPLLFVGGVADLIGVNKTIAAVAVLILGIMALTVRLSAPRQNALAPGQAP
jgi:MFS family permease